MGYILGTTDTRLLKKSIETLRVKLHRSTMVCHYLGSLLDKAKLASPETTMKMQKILNGSEVFEESKEQAGGSENHENP